MNKKITILGAVLIGLAIILGAFGAHALKSKISSEILLNFETGIRYMMYHAFALLIIGLSTSLPNKLKKQVATFFILGIIFFSGSIFLLSLKEITLINASKIGFLTPVGGLFFIVGWMFFVYKIVNLKKG